ncbi:MAG: universal stress protein [Acidimicrobiia bacterium]
MSWQPNRIVAAVDGSEQSVGAARTAVEMARSTGATVTFVSVVRPPEGWWGLEGSPPSPEVLSEAVASGSRELSRVVSELDTTGVTFETVNELGDPASIIIALCERLDADVLVIGRRGAGLVERMMLGSVADRLAHHAPCSVLIVP